MAIEIERKFLVSKIPPIPKGSKVYEVEQYYISVYPEIRFRKIRNTNSDQWGYYLTSKNKGTQVREEVETTITEGVYEYHKEKMKGRLIRKTRIKIPLDRRLYAELDIYKDFDLIVVEVEFKNETEAKQFVPPDWFGKEVTHDLRYKNINLATAENLDDILRKEKA